VVLRKEGTNMSSKRSNRAASQAASVLAARSRDKRMTTLTPQQRSDQGRRAVGSRKDRKKQFFGLVVYWSTDRSEVENRAQDREGNAKVIALGFDPGIAAANGGRSDV
jgi:hypothetical protein